MHTYVVTDPCYLFTDEEWSSLDFHNDSKLFAEIKEKLGPGSEVALTGFGDWENFIAGQTFFADSGLVCFAEIKKEDTKDISIGKVMGMAFIESEIPLYCEMDTSNPDWTVVRVHDAAGYVEYTSLELDDLDEEDD